LSRCPFYYGDDEVLCCLLPEFYGVLLCIISVNLQLWIDRETVLEKEVAGIAVFVRSVLLEIGRASCRERVYMPV
jgi:hypothetical protein